jgi:hypothetical protein
LRVLAFRTDDEEDEADEVLPPALLVLATDARLLLRLLEMTLRVDGLEAEGFLAMLLPLLDLLPALLVVAVLLLEEREDPPDDGLPKREELVLERPLEEEEEEELTTLAEIKARLIFLIVLRKPSSSYLDSSENILQ